MTAKRVSDMIRDLQQYVRRFSMRLSTDALTVFREVETLARSVDDDVYPWTFLAVLLHQMQPLRAAVAREGMDVQLAYSAAIARVRHRLGSDSYGDDGSYSASEHRQLRTRTTVLDLAMAAAKDRSRAVISIDDVLAALLHDYEITVVTEGDVSQDRRMATGFYTLSHVLGEYEPHLCIRFSTLRRQLGLPEPGSGTSISIDNVLPETRSALRSLLADHPDYLRNCFLIMPFAGTRIHHAISDAIRKSLTDFGFHVLRADDKIYAEDLLRNVEAYIFGCRFAVAVFERVLSEEYNPNVSLEVGYFLALGKPICLLKEKTLSRLQSDLVGRLYVEFDAQEAASTIRSALEQWLRDRSIPSLTSNFPLQRTRRRAPRR